MPWITCKPDATGPLATILPRIKTSAVRAMAEGYAANLEAAGGDIPSFRTLELGPLAKALEHSLLCAIVKPDRCIYRIVGETLRRRLGFNPVGQNYFDYVPEERLEHARRAIFMVVDQPCGFRAEVEQTYSDGRRILIEAVGFPVLSTRAGEDGLGLFCEQTMDRVEIMEKDRPTYLGSNVVRRDLIDLGYGVDKDFEDLIQTA